MKKIKILIIDDSKLMRDMLSTIFSSDPEIEVVGTASDPYIARNLIKKTNPDILTLDIMMPNMDGITFLKNLMRLHPLPVVMISSLTQKNSSYSLEALAIGAIDYIPKPSLKDFSSKLYVSELITTIKNASKAIVQPQMTQKKVDVPLFFNERILNANLLHNNIITIGASIGGIEAIETILTQLPAIFPPIIITQHIRKEFSLAFSNRINKLCKLTVKQAENKELLTPGFAYMAPYDLHVTIKKVPEGNMIVLNNNPPLEGHRPSINILFTSVAESIGKNAIGILLTGMGTDGAMGLKKIHDTGGITIAQDEESSVVWGMPGAAVKLNAADYVLPLDQIVAKVFQILDEKYYSTTS